jgi:hypothetical protein
MLPITAPILKTILMSFGHIQVQDVSYEEGSPKVLNTIIPKRDINWIQPIKKHLESFKEIFGPVTMGSTSESYNGETEYFQIGNFRVFASLKPKKHLDYLSGKDNEGVFYNNIKQYIDQYGIINIKFLKENQKFVLVNDVDGIRNTSLSAVQEKVFKKADIVLNGKFHGDFSISLKENRFPAWASVEVIWQNKGRILQYALDKYPEIQLVSVVGGKTEQHFSNEKSIAIKCSSLEAEKVIFGTDILGRGAIISQTWKSSHFDWDNRSRTLIIECQDIISSMSDITPKLWPYYQLRNHSGHKSKFLPGIAAIAVPFENIFGGSGVLILNEVAKNYMKEFKYGTT